MVNASSVAPSFSGEEDYNNISYYDGFQVYETSICSLTVLSCLCGLVGNGMVIWLLSFCIKRSPFTTYILNLAIADFGTLLGFSVSVIVNYTVAYSAFRLVFSFVFAFIFFTYSASLHFLTAISLERCLSVLFPIWYRCHRPKRCSSVVSFFLWVIPGLLSGILLVFYYHWLYGNYVNALKTIFTANLLIFTPIMVASTLIMSIKIFCSSQKRQPPRLYITILVTLLIFIIFAVPLSAMYFSILFNDGPASFLQFECSFLLASFNSSINPVIYYFVGRGWKKSREPLKVVLKRAFRE